MKFPDWKHLTHHLNRCSIELNRPLCYLERASVVRWGKELSMTVNQSQTLGKRVQALRKEQALTHEALAECMGVTPQAVSK